MAQDYRIYAAPEKSKRRFFACFCSKGDEPPIRVEVEDLYPEYADAPKAFRCPITMNIMLEPVATCDGHTYEKSAIEEWLLVKKTSPVTGQRLRTTELLTNHALKVAIQRWIEEKEGKRKQATIPDTRKKPEEADFFTQIGSNAAMLQTQLQKQLQDSVGQSLGAIEIGWKATANAFGQATSSAASTIGQLPQLAGPLFQGFTPQPQLQAEATAITRGAETAQDRHGRDDAGRREGRRRGERRGNAPRGRMIAVRS